MFGSSFLPRDLAVRVFGSDSQMPDGLIAADHLKPYIQESMMQVLNKRQWPGVQHADELQPAGSER